MFKDKRITIKVRTSRSIWAWAYVTVMFPALCLVIWWVCDISAILRGQYIDLFLFSLKIPMAIWLARLGGEIDNVWDAVTNAEVREILDKTSM